MDKAICSRCKVKKEKSTENFHFRNDTKSFRRMCKTCMKNKTIKRIKSKTYYYEDMLEIFKRNGLTPLMEKHDNAIPVKQRIDSIDSDGYKVRATIDKLKSRQDKPRPFSSHNPHTIENIKKFIDVNNLNITLLSDFFLGNQEKLVMLCSKGHEFNTRWSDFKRRKRCTKCSAIVRRTDRSFREEVRKISDGEYVFIDDFVNVDVSIRVKHVTCGNVYKVTPYHFINREQRCPRCQESKGERRIQKFLTRHNIKHYREYSFDDCKLELPLRFDFAIKEKSGIRLLIEFDGRQHFEAVTFYGGVRYLKLTQKRDRIKNDYAKENNIPLLRIPYTEYDNIEEILTTHLL